MTRARRWISRIRTAGVASIRRRPLRSTALLALLIAAAAGLGGYGWAVFSWQRARTDFEAHRFDEAGRRLEFCRKVWPDDPDALLLSAKVSRRSGDFAAATAYLNRYFQIHPKARDAAQIEYLLLRVQMGDDEAADPLFALVEQDHPESPAILDAVSTSYMQRLRYQAANACLSKWIELRPAEALPYDRRGWVYEHTANPALAYRDYQKALELDPGLVPVRLRLVEMLLEEKKVPEVAPHLEILERQAPERVEVKARLGMLRFLEGRSREARQLLEDVEPKLDKNDAAPVVYLARLDVQEGKGADAERRLRKVIALDPTETEARFVLVSALRLQGREAEAVAVQQEQIRLNERNIRLNQLLRDRADKPDATTAEWFEIGSLFLEMQMEPRARYWFDKVLAKDPNHQGTHRVLMEYHIRKGDPEQAASHRRMLR